MVKDRSATFQGDAEAVLNIHLPCQRRLVHCFHFGAQKSGKHGRPLPVPHVARVHKELASLLAPFVLSASTKLLSVSIP